MLLLKLSLCWDIYDYKYILFLVFSWFFNDEPIKKGKAGWEDIEIHDSRKMSTLILT